MRPSRTLRIRADLDHVKPPIWRRFLVASDTTLAELHHLLQGAFGWDDCHLHEFRQGTRRIGMRGGPDDLLGEDETQVTVGELLRLPGDALKYHYDFGDDWIHNLKLEAVLPPEDDARALPRVTGGARSCPPEDCGGPPGFHAFLLEQALDRDGPCIFDPRAFDLAETDARISWLRSAPAREEATWSPLEEQLAWRRLAAWAASPGWQETVEQVRSVFELALDGLAEAEERAEVLAEPEVVQLREDFLACDLLREREPQAVIPELLASPEGRDLPPGCVRFLEALLESFVGVYEIEEVAADGTLTLFDCVANHALRAAPPGPDFDGEAGELLISRLLPGPGGLPRLRGALLAPFDEEATEAFLLELKREGETAGCDVEDAVSLLKACAPLLFVHWYLQVNGAESGLPLCVRPGEDWEPGVGEYRLPRGMTPEQFAERLAGRPEFGSLSEHLWCLVTTAPAAGDDEDVTRRAEGWVKLDGRCLYLFAGGRPAMLRLRQALKRAAGPELRHSSTRYDADLELPVIRIEGGMVGLPAGGPAG